MQRAQDVAAQVESGTLDTPLPVHGDEDAYIDVRAADGHAVARTSNLKQDTPVATFRPEDDDPEIRTQKIPCAGRRTTSGSWRSTPQGPTYGAVTIYVVASLDRVKETATAVRHLLRWGVPLLVALVGGDRLVRRRPRAAASRGDAGRGRGDHGAGPGPAGAGAPGATTRSGVWPRR